MGRPYARIMVVDDDPGVRLAMGALLRDEGFVVDLVSTGLCALKMVREDPPDVILVDLRMPEMDGLTLCGALRELNRALPVIVITASSETTSAVGALRAGAVDFLTKPVDVDAMLLSIARATDRLVIDDEREQLRVRTEELYQRALGAVAAHEEVLAIVSHDLLNPLGVIALRGEQLGELVQGGEVEKVPAVVASIRRCTARMQGLIADLVDESRTRTGLLKIDRRDHPLSQLLADTDELRLVASRKHMHLEIKPPKADRLVSCDRARVAQVLGNLVANAIKFSPEGSPISVSAEDVDGWVRFAVRDQGTGIPTETLPRVFDRFWQSRGSVGAGLGLGLFIVKSIAEAHGGRAWAESTPGVGSTFYFDLPGAGARDA